MNPITSRPINPPIRRATTYYYRLYDPYATEKPENSQLYSQLFRSRRAGPSLATGSTSPVNADPAIPPPQASFDKSIQTEPQASAREGERWVTPQAI